MQRVSVMVDVGCQVDLGCQICLPVNFKKVKGTQSALGAR